MAIYAVIMAGGSGTRLWPLSRQQRPKQALPLIGQRTLVQEAIDRIRPLIPPERILVVTRYEHAALLRDQAPELPPANFVIEPDLQEVDLRKYLGPAREAMTARARERIQFFGASGKAA